MIVLDSIKSIVLGLGLLLFGGAYSMGQTKKLVHASPNVRIDKAYKLTNDITIIPDPRINYVPNIGLVEGKKAILIVDTGIGSKNGQKVFSYAKKIAKGRKIYLSTTHFHPEHSFGTDPFNKGGATVIMNKLQANELNTKGEVYLNMFKQFGKIERTALKNTKIGKVDELYSGKKILDLGDKTVEFYETPAHTLGDQLIFVPSDGVLFTGDLVEERFFPIMPDADTKPSQWIEVIQQARQLNPKIVVPGHGSVGGIELINEVDNYLRLVKQEVKTLVEKGLSQDEILITLKKDLADARPNWDNAVFIPYEISHFYAELTKTPVILPKLSTELNSDKKE